IAANTGILVVNSAGNEGNSGWQYIGAPADADSILTVGAVDSLGVKASFSSIGPTFDGRIKPNVSSQGVLAAIVLP
ncbi:S8 family serine peptidase, partial [Klebsiella pneumoniae]|nr:S8 family serine peptidase [Klebsiella pneumoniae]